MFIEERHENILEILSAEGSITCAKIQELFNISYDSAKRDLRILEEKGLLKRTRGGALPIRQVATGKPANMTCKDNDVVFITSATVGYFMAQNLPADIRIRAVTNSIVIAEELRAHDNVSVIMLGGEMDNKGNCYDTIAVETIKRLRFDKCFLTSACISADFGLSIQRTDAISFWNAVIDSSRKTIGLYPTEKIGFESIVSICPANRLDVMITDWEACEEDLQKFEKQGIEIIVAEKQ